MGVSGCSLKRIREDTVHPERTAGIAGIPAKRVISEGEIAELGSAPVIIRVSLTDPF